MWKMASQALMWERKAFPSPCPEWAPFTRPAMSTTFRKAGTLLESQTRRRWDQKAVTLPQTWVHHTHLAGLWYWQRKSKRSSGTGTLLSLGSIVQNGKFSAAAWLLVSTLKNVDFLWWMRPERNTSTVVLSLISPNGGYFPLVIHINYIPDIR